MQNFVKGAQANPTAVLQIASKDAVLVVHIGACGGIPTRVAELLNDQQVLKVGSGVARDLQELCEQHPQLHPHPWYVDFAAIGPFLGYKVCGLKTMSRLFGLEVPNSQRIATSDWAKSPLSESQLGYAACDAVLGLWLLGELWSRHADGAPILDWASMFANTPGVRQLLQLPDSHWPPSMQESVQAQKVEEAERARKAQERKEQKRVQDAERKRAAAAVPSERIGIFNLPFTTTAAELEDLVVTQAGKLDVEMTYRPNGDFRGCAYVVFDTVENATRAIDALQGLAVGTQAIDVRFATKPEPGGPKQPKQGSNRAISPARVPG
uniref:3'-5' exonuclease n=1 Tax=Eutreptiella gymnastica TaxID=73025 RepID=A0A7S1J658_9EUGL